ncbi:L-lysine 2-3-aminomutase [Penicillium mononematosum]|nr:L-lysine 2-3-aminomutase [Penicillium mononematosum]
MKFIPELSTDGTYDHTVWKIGLPVRSAVLKPHAGELVVGWVTTSESSLLYVFVFLFIHRIHENWLMSSSRDGA